MEPKSGSRTLKKSASGAALAGDRKKAKQKKKKEKRKPSVKGTESTDVPSPELDSEVLLDGDVTLTTDQEGQVTPVAGQVTRLPHLTSQTSLTTLTTGTPPPSYHHHHHHLVNSSTRKASLGGGHHSSNSAPTTRSTADPAAATTAPSALITIPSNNLDGVVARVAHLNIKQRASKNRSKTQTTSSTKPSGKPSRGVKDHLHRRGIQSKVSDASSSKGGSQSGSGSGTGTGTSSSNESLRWELALENVEQERERLAVYKMNRRKRYLAAAQAKGLGWALNYSSQTNLATPLSEDSGVETACGSPGMTSTTTTTTTTSSSSTTATSASPYIDFSSMQTLRPLPGRTGLQEAFVEC